MNWIDANHLFFGLSADAATFFGALTLTVDALLRLRDLKNNRTDRRFRETFPSIKLSPEDWEAARWSVYRALAGAGLLLLGFLCQMLLRLAESR